MSPIAATALPEHATTARTVRSVELRGPAGRLEALVNDGATGAAYAALVCHPHPLGGGTLHNKVVYQAMRALNAPQWGLGWPVLRFNFRGAGLSDGAHHGRAETGDVLAGVNWLEREYKLPVVVVGFSFGAAMSLMACCGRHEEGRPSVRAIAALGLPTQAEGREYQYPFLKDCSIPKLFLSGDRDQYAPSESLKQVVDAAGSPKELVFIPAADHFFAGQLEPMQQALTCWVKEQVS